jgi:hypothetical protein
MIRAVPNKKEAAYGGGTCRLDATRQHPEKRHGFCEGSSDLQVIASNTGRISLVGFGNIRMTTPLFATDAFSVTYNVLLSMK